jgi:hypothetical protein
MLHRLFLASFSLSVLVLGGCENPVLMKVIYDKPVRHTSDKSGSIQLEVFVPVSTGVWLYPFNMQDQRIFVESLKDEINRLKLLRVSQVSEERIEGADVSIEIVFEKTSEDRHLHYYFLNVAMRLKSGKQSFANRYHIRSWEGESLWTQMNTHPAEGKEKAARKLMAKLIPDIEKFVGSIE